MLALIKRMTVETERELRKLFDADHAQVFFAQDDTISSQARIVMNMLMKKYAKLFGARARPMAEKFGNGADKAAASAVQETLKDLSSGLSLGTRHLDAATTEILKATIEENVNLIKTIPQKYLNGVQGQVMRSITTGNGLQDLVPYLAKNKGVTERRARMIAKDQSRKASTSLARSRMVATGIRKWQWHHVAGGKTSRALHAELHGQIFSFDDPPPLIQKATKSLPVVYGFPGQLISCRCRMSAVVDFGED